MRTLKQNQISECKAGSAAGALRFVCVLGAFAASLQANALLTMSNLNCTFTTTNPASSSDCGPGGTNIAQVAQLAQQSNGIAGVAYGLSTTLTDNSLGTNSALNTVLSLSTSGTPTGSGVIAPLSMIMGWDFTLGLGVAGGHAMINNWTITFDIRDVVTNASLFSSLPTVTSGPLNITSTTPVTFSGGQPFNLTSSIDPSNGHPLQQITVLTVNWTGQNNVRDNLSIQFAANGLDFNDVPEPATFGLSSAALAMIVWSARRRRASKCIRAVVQ